MDRTNKVLSFIDESIIWLVKEGLIISIPLLIVEQIFIHFDGHPMFVRSTLIGLIAIDAVDHLIANSGRIKRFFSKHFLKDGEDDGQVKDI